MSARSPHPVSRRKKIGKSWLQFESIQVETVEGLNTIRLRLELESDAND